MSRLFICYSRVDKRLAEELAQLLRKAYDHVWYDDNLHGGEEWWAEIVREIAGCDHFIFLMSDDALASDWCQKELAEARANYKQIVPVLVRARTEVPEELGRIQRIDMSCGITVETLNQLYATLIRYANYDSRVDPRQRHLDQQLLERLWPYINGRYVEILTGEAQNGKIDWERYSSHITKYLDLRSKERNHFMNTALEATFEAFDDALVSLDGQIGWTYEMREVEARPYMVAPTSAANDTYWFEKLNKLMKKMTAVWMQHVELVGTIRSTISDFDLNGDY